MELGRRENIEVNRIIDIGQSVVVKKVKGEQYGRSNFQDIDSENIYIMQPTDEKGYPLSLLPNEEVMISFIGKTGKRYGFISRVTKHIRNPLFLIGIKKPKDIYVVELREYFRVPVLIPFVAKKAIEKRNEDGSTEYVATDESFTGYVQDISAGGMFITTNYDLKVGDSILITPFIEKDKVTKKVQVITKKKEVTPTIISKPREEDIAFVDLPAKVVRKVVIDPKEKKYGYGIKFDIDENTREKIMLFCFNRQRELKSFQQEEEL